MRYQTFHIFQNKRLWLFGCQNPLHFKKQSSARIGETQAFPCIAECLTGKARQQHVKIGNIVGRNLRNVAMNMLFAEICLIDRQSVGFDFRTEQTLRPNAQAVRRLLETQAEAAHTCE